MSIPNQSKKQTQSHLPLFWVGFSIVGLGLGGGILEILAHATGLSSWTYLIVASLGLLLIILHFVFFRFLSDTTKE